METGDHLVVEVPGRALRRAEDVGALVAVLEAAGVVPAGRGVRVGNRLGDLVAGGADLDVGVLVTVRRLDRAEVFLGPARELGRRVVDGEGQIRVDGAARGLAVVRAVGRARLEVDCARVSRGGRRAGEEAGLDVLGRVQHVRSEERRV